MDRIELAKAWLLVAECAWSYADEDEEVDVPELDGALDMVRQGLGLTDAELDEAVP